LYKRILISSGFTLLEILIALAVLTISLSAILKSTMVTTDNISYLRNKTIAHWIAMNQINIYRVNKKLASNDYGEIKMLKQIWCWQTNIFDTSEKKLKRVEVEVAIKITHELCEKTIKINNLVKLTSFINQLEH
jgi:general secretion pathway protein I